jgi:hypothetical protein
MTAMHLKDALTRTDTHLECFQNQSLQKWLAPTRGFTIDLIFFLINFQGKI